MRRAVARGRVFPQSYSTDRRYGRLSLKACALFPLMWTNADDQGRLVGDPEEIKYACCPNIDHITKADVPEILKELEAQKLIKVYDTGRSLAIQLLDWWNIQRPQWAWPSDYPPADGWQDHLRYKKSAKDVVKLNWFSGETEISSQVSTESSSPETLNDAQVSDAQQRESTKEKIVTLKENTEKEKERRNSPESQKGSQVSKNTQKAKKIWSKTLLELKKSVNAPNYSTWLADSEGLAIRESVFTVGVKSQHIIDYLQRNQRFLIEKVLSDIMSRPMSAAFQVLERSP